jgi:hypothetical protein
LTVLSVWQNLMLLSVDFWREIYKRLLAFYHEKARVTYEMPKVWAGNVSSFSLSLLRRPFLQ